MLNSKQRAALRALANSLEPIVHIGKGGVIDTIVKQADDALTARELIKGRVLEAAPVSAREAADALGAGTNSEVVQVIGRNFVLFRRTDPVPKPVHGTSSASFPPDRVTRTTAIHKGLPEPCSLSDKKPARRCARSESRDRVADDSKIKL